MVFEGQRDWFSTTQNQSDTLIPANSSLAKQDALYSDTYTKPVNDNTFILAVSNPSNLVIIGIDNTGTKVKM